MAVHTERIETPDGSTIATLTIDRPPVNAFDLRHLELLTTHIQPLADDPEVRGMVVTGAGRTFSAGIDTTELEGRTASDKSRLFSVIDDTVTALLDLGIPVGAAVNGHALGGGLLLALLADIRLAANGDYRLGLPEAAAGVPFPAMAAEVIRQELHPALIRHLAISGQTITTSEAVSHRIVDQIVDPATLLQTTCIQVARLAKLPAFADVKRQLRCLHDRPKPNTRSPVRTVETRRLAPADAAAVAAMVRRCTDKTLYLRLLGGLDAVHAIADPIKHAKPCGRVDIGAFTGQHLIGIASLVPARGAWEAAILVEDAWQGNQIGSHLADSLVQHAIRLGIDTIRVTYGGRNRKAASLVTSRTRDLTGLSVSTGVIERYVTPEHEEGGRC